MKAEMKTWMVRAGESGLHFDSFRDGGFVGIGWSRLGDLSKIQSRNEIAQLVRVSYPEFRDQAVAMTAGQLFRFAREIQVSDSVVTYDPRARSYLCGLVAGEYTFEPSSNEEVFRNQRRVEWSHETSRDKLTATARNSLGAISTLFFVAEPVSRELWSEAAAPSALPLVLRDVTPSLISASDQQVAAAASEAIKDRIEALDWDQMQELVAGLLRAMGYKTEVSPPGSDRGKDIVASPDGFGFQEPRIVVEVKHRVRDRIGSQDIRGFLGGRHANDKGLFVSTGGFTKDAYYEAERANIPLTLLDFEGLVRAILDNYSKFDEITRQILPLTTIHWPVTR